MVPIRWVAEALGADVQWDEHTNAVRINSSQCPPREPLSKEQIAAIIQAQGKHKDSYYVDGLSYDFANVDGDGLRVFGPRQAAAEIEGSKSFAMN
jgi:hypothetical protein